MEGIKRLRSTALLLIFALVLGFYITRMYDKQVIETGGVVNNATTFTTKTRVKAARGDILDCNGNVLVGNRASYDIVINHYIITNAEGTNQYIYDLLKLCEKLGIEYNEHFPMTKTRPFTYTLDEASSTWQKNFQVFLKARGDMDSDISAPLLIEKLRSSYLIPKEWTDEEARAVLGVRFELTLRNYTTMANYVFLSDASDEARAAILELNIPGLAVEASTVREYHTDYAAHILGYVGAMSPAQWEHYKTIDGYLMDAEVGQAGFELAFEEYLHGIDGERIDTHLADGTLVESHYRIEPQSGHNVEVTIDIAMQEMAEEQMEIRIKELQGNPDPTADGRDAKSAAVVVMDVKTGRVLVCASYPTYNPSRFFEDFAELSKDETDPLYNRALMAALPPGSTYKMCMVIAAMNNGIINMDTPILDKGIFDKYSGESGNFDAECMLFKNNRVTHKGANPEGLVAKEALKVSCNYFFYELADRMSIEKIDETAKGLGLGEPTGVELPEGKGWRSNPETKAHFQEGMDAVWYTADKILTGIGQGENRFTPIQLCVYVSTLANQGTRYEATFLNRVVSSDYRQLVADNQPSIVGHFDICNDAILAYTQGMVMVTSESGGTGYKVFSNYPIKVAGKTGTAQLGIKGKSDNGAFVCYAPADDPEIAVVVYGEQVGSGSAMAYIARDILNVYFGIGKVGEVELVENQLS
ncbi:MAG: hypothetical protein IJN53_05825 [Oscillospiraceae bacterium]|nr:hypothetical protein [Oscillospiraceae bacterium]